MASAKYIKTKFSALDGKTKVAYKLDSSDPDPFQMLSSPEGMELSGKLFLETEEDLNEFAEQVSKAWQERRKLDPAKGIVVVRDDGHH